MEYKITITFKHFDAKPLVVLSNSNVQTEYDKERREPVYTSGYPAAFVVACADVLHITTEKATP
jgi:hypothetical protein